MKFTYGLYNFDKIHNQNRGWLRIDIHSNKAWQARTLYIFSDQNIFQNKPIIGHRIESWINLKIVMFSKQSGRAQRKDTYDRKVSSNNKIYILGAALRIGSPEVVED